MSYLATNLKKLRKAKRLSQSQFAQIFGMTRAAVGAYEEGRAEPKLDKLIEIARYFGLTVDQLIAKKLTINEIYHYDKKVSAVESIKFVPLADKQDFINFMLKKVDKFDFKYIYFPGLIAQLAIETANFFNLKKAILFLKKLSKPKDELIWIFQIKEADYFFKYSKPGENWQEIWEITAVLTNDFTNCNLTNLKLQQIETKLDLILKKISK